MYNKITQVYFLLFIIILVAGCEKNTKLFKSEILSVENIQWNQAEANVEFNFINKKNKSIEVGICVSTEPKPNQDDILSSTEIKSSGEKNFYLTNLKPWTKYYIRSYIKDYEGFMNFSEEVSFVTPEIVLPCSIPSHAVSLNGTNKYFGNLTVVPDSLNAVYKSSSYLGYFQFEFKDTPTTGLYTTKSFAAEITQADKVYISAYLKVGSWLCFHLTNSNQNVKVINNDGVLEISFCDFIFVAGSSCSENVYQVSGTFSTQ